MWLRIGLSINLLCSASVIFHAAAFNVAPTAKSMGRPCFQTHHTRTPNRSLLNASSDEDCGCGPTVFDGKPPTSAIRDTIDHRAVIGSLPLYNVDGEKTSIDDIIGYAKENPNKTSLVVFLRSLG
jgi:hypothetical protein